MKNPRMGRKATYKQKLQCKYTLGDPPPSIPKSVFLPKTDHVRCALLNLRVQRRCYAIKINLQLSTCRVASKLKQFSPVRRPIFWEEFMH